MWIELDDWSRSRYATTNVSDNEAPKKGVVDDDENIVTVTPKKTTPPNKTTPNKTTPNKPLTAPLTTTAKTTHKNVKKSKAWCLAESLDGSVYLYSLLPPAVSPVDKYANSTVSPVDKYANSAVNPDVNSTSAAGDESCDLENKSFEVLKMREADVKNESFNKIIGNLRA